MVKVHILQTEGLWTDEALSQRLAGLPAEMQKKILLYKNPKDRQMRIAGKLLLQQALADFAPHLSLSNMKQPDGGKPYFEAAFDFSIAHSGDLVLCAIADGLQTGADVEQHAPFKLSEFEDLLTKNELQFIANAADSREAFFETWTKKEAMMKALGLGFEPGIKRIETLDGSAVCKGKKYYFSRLPLPQGYSGHLVTSAPSGSVSVSFEKL